MYVPTMGWVDDKKAEYESWKAYEERKDQLYRDQRRDLEHRRLQQQIDKRERIYD